MPNGNSQFKNLIKDWVESFLHHLGALYDYVGEEMIRSQLHQNKRITQTWKNKTNGSLRPRKTKQTDHSDLEKQNKRITQTWKNKTNGSLRPGKIKQTDHSDLEKQNKRITQTWKNKTNGSLRPGKTKQTDHSDLEK